MNLEDVSRQIIAFTGTFNIWLMLVIFLSLSIGEFGLAIPYVMESIWILVGYHIISGALSIPQLLILLAISLVARLVGAFALYRLTWLERGPIMRLYHRLFGSVLKEETNEGNNKKPLLVRILHRIKLSSPYSIAFGRLIWLRVPLTLILSMQRNLVILLQGVMLSGIAWDATYILIGILGGNIKIDPINVVLYSLGGLTVIYGAAFAIRFFVDYWLAKH